MAMFNDKLTKALSSIAKDIMEGKTKAEAFETCADCKTESKCMAESKCMGEAYEEVVDEAINTTEAKDSNYTAKHKTFSSAIQHAVEVAMKRGYEVDPDDYDRKVAMGPKKPSEGKTNSYSLKLMKDGKEQRKALQVQIANLDNKFYELNMYIQ